MKIPFTKMHGCGNDFVIIDAREENLSLTQNQKKFLADRNEGIGCDQLIILEASENADVLMRIYNPDGREAQACGNATRCVANLLAGKDDEINIETIERVLPCRIFENGEVSVNMGQVVSYAPVHLGDIYKDLRQSFFVDVGNPHCVFLTNNAEEINLQFWGETTESHDAFKPDRTNVEFVSSMGRGNFRVRVWERGAGITKACGSGAVAVTWVLRQEGLISEYVELQMDGGTLYMQIKDNNDIVMQGKVKYVFATEIELPNE